LSSSADSKVRTRPKVAGQRSRTRAIPASAPHAPAKATPTTTVREAARAAARPAPVAERSTPRPAGEGARDATPTRRLVPPRGWVAPVAALVASLVLLGALVGVSLRDSGAQARAERAAASQARTSVEQMLSYNYKTIDAQSAQIESLLTGSFKSEFATAMDQVIKPLAVKNQTVVQAKASDVGVMSSTPTSVKVLVFVNQAKVGADSQTPAVDQNRVIATMSKVGERWLISKVDAF
jgi:Mce-associated membrane protein